MTVRADGYRKDIERSSLKQPLAGFHFPIYPTLRRLLPHGGSIEVTAHGHPIRLLPSCDPTIDNPTVRSMAPLMEKLGSGYIITPKHGAIFKPVRKRDGLAHALASVEAYGRIFKEVVGKDLFICYGTLLGHVRDGDLIEHDDDIDLCFLADSNGWPGALAEFKAAVERLRSAGERIHVDNAVQFHWYSKTGGALDIFMGWLEDDYLNMFEAGGVLPRGRILPLRQQRFQGTDVLVPNDPEALLQIIYGEGWRVPDPNFQWRRTPEIAERMELYRNAVADINRDGRGRYWSQFYERRQRTVTPSSFAASVATELTGRCWIADVGCGDGRDAFFLASLGHHVLGLDAAETVIRRNEAFAKDGKRERVAFRQADVSKPGVLKAALRHHLEAASSASGFVVYGRFLMHAVTDDEERTILEALAELPSGSRCYFEFRTAKDARLFKRFGGHYRRFVELDAFIERTAEIGRLDCHYSIEGRGMAKYGEEDPIVARLHLQRR